MEFRGEYRFLSSFHHCRFYYNGTVYGSAEAAYQGAKCLRPSDRLEFATMGAAEAKHNGRLVKIKANWDRVKVQVMTDVTACKFSQNPELAERLVLTYPSHLYEGNRWRDTYWGVDRDLQGENWLGVVLMWYRERLIEEEIKGVRVDG